MSDPKMPTLEQVFASLPGVDDDPDAYASAAAVAEATGLSKSTVNSRLSELKAAGRVHVAGDSSDAPMYRQADDATAEADAAGEAAEATQDGGEWPPTSEVPAADPDSTTVTGGAPPAAPRKRAKRAAKAAKPAKAGKASKDKTEPKTTPANDKGSRKFAGPSLQDAVLSHVQTDAEKAWGIYEIAKALHAYPTSVGYALKRLAVKGNVTRVQDTPPRYKAA